MHTCTEHKSHDHSGLRIVEGWEEDAEKSNAKNVSKKLNAKKTQKTLQRLDRDFRDDV